jgi:septum formation protein
LNLGVRLFRKPDSPEVAKQQLELLAGRTHELHSACVIVRDGVVVAEFFDTAEMIMRELDCAFIERYIKAAGTTVQASVGGYQAEGLGAHLFQRMNGDISTIMGLPILPLLDELRRLGLVAS